MTANGAPYDTAPPPNCPKCGKPLIVYRLLQPVNDQQEPFEFYMCRAHGFFLHDQRRTEAGLREPFGRPSSALDGHKN